MTNLLQTFPEIHRFRPISLFTHLLQITFIRLSTVFAKGRMMRGFRFSSRPHGFFFMAINIVFSPSNVISWAPVVLYFILKLKNRCWRFIQGGQNNLFLYLFESKSLVKEDTFVNKRNITRKKELKIRINAGIKWSISPGRNCRWNAIPNSSRRIVFHCYLRSIRSRVSTLLTRVARVPFFHFAKSHIVLHVRHCFET